MKPEQSIDELLSEIKLNAIEKHKAEKARVNAEEKIKRARYNYLRLMEDLRNKEYVLE